MTSLLIFLQKRKRLEPLVNDIEKIIIIAKLFFFILILIAIFAPIFQNNTKILKNELRNFTT